MSDSLATYLNNHLAGSMGGLTLIEHIAREFSGTPTGSIATELQAEFEDERRQLKELIERIGARKNLPRGYPRKPPN